MIKRGRGRPTKYKPEFAEKARQLCRLGATTLEVADFLGINVATLWRWVSLHPEFCDGIKVGKEANDERVQTSLYHKAIGYSRDVEKVYLHEGEPVRVPVREHIPPSDTACIFWLKNRRPDLWRDRVDLNGKMHHSGTIQIEPQMAKILESLSTEELLVLEGVFRRLEDGDATDGVSSEARLIGSGQGGPGEEGSE